MPDRVLSREVFLRNEGIDASKLLPLAGDASFRTYHRAPQGVLMDAPPPEEDVRPFVRVARHLSNLGLSAPSILACDAERGFLLLEDLGDDLFSLCLKRGMGRYPLYEAAVDMLAELVRHSSPPEIPPYDIEALMQEADLFLEWYLPAVGGTCEDETRVSWREAWEEALAPAFVGVSVLTLRDCHVDNLLWLPERSPPANVGLLDFQDALAGHPAYDLASLLDDVRTEVPDDLVENMTRRFLTATGLGESAFRNAFAALSAQRSTKILGIFTRLARRDSKLGYLAWIPSTWNLLERRIREPGLEPVQTWFERHVPVSLRSLRK